jgi:hypothetical protein
MADRKGEIQSAKITNQHFIFSTENSNEVDFVILSYKNGNPPKENQKIRRI